jgi:prepilin-type N-terminal cleavage/methylation domain-containing protein
MASDVQACQRRPRRSGAQAGLTLIEMLVTVALIAVGVIGITSAIAAAERDAAITQDAAAVQAAMRELSDLVRSDRPLAEGGLPYRQCARPDNYIHDLPHPPAGIVAWTILAVNESTAATRNGSATPALRSCGAGASDWGVQEITLRVASPNRSLTRIVWKDCADDPRTCPNTWP